jgi:hypothetical protein
MDDVNVKGTEHVLAACKKHGVKNLVYTSSASGVWGGEGGRGERGRGAGGKGCFVMFWRITSRLCHWSEGQGVIRCDEMVSQMHSCVRSACCSCLLVLLPRQSHRGC